MPVANIKNFYSYYNGNGKVSETCKILYGDNSFFFSSPR